MGWCSHPNVPFAAHELQTQLLQLWQAAGALIWPDRYALATQPSDGEAAPGNSCPCLHENCGLSWV